MRNKIDTSTVLSHFQKDNIVEAQNKKNESTAAVIYTYSRNIILLPTTNIFSKIRHNFLVAVATNRQQLIELVLSLKRKVYRFV